MKTWYLIAAGVTVLALLLILQMKARAKHPFRYALGSAGQGIAALGAVSLTALFTGIAPPVNLFTILWSALTGIPGVITLLVADTVLLHTA